MGLLEATIVVVVIVVFDVVVDIVVVNDIAVVLIVVADHIILICGQKNSSEARFRDFAISDMSERHFENECNFICSKASNDGGS